MLNSGFQFLSCSKGYSLNFILLLALFLFLGINQWDVRLRNVVGLLLVHLLGGCQAGMNGVSCHPPRPEVAPHSRGQGGLKNDMVKLREMITRLLFLLTYQDGED